MEQRLDEKCNITEITKLESRLTALESKIFEAEHTLACVSTVGDCVNHLEQKISSKTTGLVMMSSVTASCPMKI